MTRFLLCFSFILVLGCGPGTPPPEGSPVAALLDRADAPMIVASRPIAIDPARGNITINHCTALAYEPIARWDQDHGNRPRTVLEFARHVSPFMANPACTAREPLRVKFNSRTLLTSRMRRDGTIFVRCDGRHIICRNADERWPAQRNISVYSGTGVRMRHAGGLL